MLTGCTSGAQQPGGPGRLRTYFIAAEEVDWDYAPSGRDQITGRPFDQTAKVFLQRGPGWIGSRYLEALYRGYTDASFRIMTAARPAEGPLGLLGPVIRAEVGDTVRVVFRNRTGFPTSIHAHGKFYAKDSEGAPYADGTSAADRADDAVAPGGTYVYTWKVPVRAGPGPMDGSSIMWMYHSHVDEVRDTNTGLVGPIVVTRRGAARPDATPKDADREVFALFSVINENESYYLERNVRRFALPPYADPADEGFEESNLMHSINGMVYGSLPIIRMHRGERVRWYTMAMGTEVDLHTPHWHGNTVVSNGMRTDVVNLLPATMATADMRPDDPGTWLFHCHVNDHIHAGMQARYEVLS